MPTIPQRIASAFAVLSGRYGDVTAMAKDREQSRQSLYRESAKVVESVEGSAAEARIDDLRRQLADREVENQALRGRLERAVEITRDTQQEFAAVAQAEGVSLGVARRLLNVVAGSEPTPSVATLGRATLGAGDTPEPCSKSSTRRPAGGSSRPPPMRFFGPRPALMVVEPESLCGMTGRIAKARDGLTWAEQFARFPALRAVARDDGTGLGKGVRLDNARRREAGLPEFDQTLDVFHTLREGGRALKKTWGVATRALEQAEMAQAELDRRGRQGRSRQGHGTITNRLWRQAERLWGRAEAAETAWTQARSAFECFTPDGRLNDRARAAAVVESALPLLSGAAWAKTRRLLLRAESFTFLDQVQERLTGLGLDPGLARTLGSFGDLRRAPWESFFCTILGVAFVVAVHRGGSDGGHSADRFGRDHAAFRGVGRPTALCQK